MVSRSSADIALGKWAGGDFKGTVSQYGGIGTDTDVPDETRFVAGIVSLIVQRKAELEARDELMESDIAIFLLKPVPPDSVQNAQRVPMVNNGLTPLGGRLWFAPAVVGSARYVQLPPNTNDDERLCYVTDQLELGSCPAIIFDPRPTSPQLRWYPEGLGNLENYELKHMEGDVNPQEVFETIDVIYSDCFVTPDALPQAGNMWEKASEFRPIKNAEALVQAFLKVGLKSRFPYCIIRHEQTQATGRTDLEIEQLDPLDHSVVTRHAIIELKVLRSYWSTGSRVSDGEAGKWIREGMVQAAAYRKEKVVRWSAVCCFDMRSHDIGDAECFDPVRECACKLSVVLRRWFLFANADDYRQAIVGTD